MNKDNINPAPLESTAAEENKITENFVEQERKPRHIKGIMVRASSLVLLMSAAYFGICCKMILAAYNLNGIDSQWGTVLFIIAGGLFLFRAGFFIYNLYLYFRYKPIECSSNEALPTCTVIVPAYNEGKQVWATLMSLAKSDYPAHKLQLLAIDDGSKDDTWEMDAKG